MADKSFDDYKSENYSWITLASSEYYPDYIQSAKNYYGPVLAQFRTLLTTSASSAILYRSIMNRTSGWMRIQLCRVFKRCISPTTPVELLKRKASTEANIDGFRSRFRKIAEAQAAFLQRPDPDEALCTLLWEYKDRGKPGYDLTGTLFQMLRETIEHSEVDGPEGAGQDIQLRDVWNSYPTASRPVDFIIKVDGEIVAVGLARYDGDRGGAQEDDRIGQYREVAREIIEYCDAHEMPVVKVIFVNDGPGLLAGSMWDDYGRLDKMIGNRVKVATLRMVPERITQDWLLS